MLFQILYIKIIDYLFIWKYIPFVLSNEIKNAGGRKCLSFFHHQKQLPTHIKVLKHENCLKNYQTFFIFNIVSKHHHIDIFCSWFFEDHKDMYK